MGPLRIKQTVHSKKAVFLRDLHQLIGSQPSKGADPESRAPSELGRGSHSPCRAITFYLRTQHTGFSLQPQDEELAGASEVPAFIHIDCKVWKYCTIDTLKPYSPLYRMSHFIFIKLCHLTR